jgi:hypothetical protein
MSLLYTALLLVSGMADNVRSAAWRQVGSSGCSSAQPCLPSPGRLSQAG